MQHQDLPCQKNDKDTMDQAKEVDTLEVKTPMCPPTMVTTVHVPNLESAEPCQHESYAQHPDETQAMQDRWRAMQLWLSDVDPDSLSAAIKAKSLIDLDRKFGRIRSYVERLKEK